MIKIPPPIQTIFAGLLMYVMDLVLPFNLYSHNVVVTAVIVVMSLVSLVLLLLAVLSFINNKTTVNPLKPESTTTLVVGGVYRLSRNPMYVGMAGILIAWCIFIANPANLVVFVLYIYVMTQIQIKPEERALQRLFGEEYREYCSKVRRWV